MSQKRIAIFGSTGSIGKQTLEVIAAHPELFVAEILTAHSNESLLIEQALLFVPNIVVIGEIAKYAIVKKALEGKPIKVFAGEEALEQVAAMDCYDTALRYSQEREQFGRPIGGFQLQQKKLAEMITEITKAQLLTWRLGVLRNEGRATTAQISMAKRNNVEIALNIAREARQIHGGMGITSEYSMMRHMANLESVVTYEGTHDIHALILGRAQTGLQAFY